MPERTHALMLGARVRFQDCWSGKVASIEITEDWEVYNVAVRHGFLKPVTVRLPLDAATDWDDGFLAFDEITSTAAFGRELPPIAAPSRPVSRETPLAIGARLAGVLLERLTRRAQEVLIERGGGLYRVPAASVTFEGKTMHLGVQPDALVPYRTDEELRERVRHALASAREISSAELQQINAEADGAEVRLTGNVRSKQTREAARRAVSAALAIPVNADALADDIELETEVGLALDRSGLSRVAEVYVRSALGEVTLRGHAPSPSAAEEAVRVAARVPGVRDVINKIEVCPPEPTPAVTAR